MGFTLNRKTARRKGGSSSDHEIFPNDIALFRAAGSEPAVLIVPGFDAGTLRRDWPSVCRDPIRAEDEPSGCHRAVGATPSGSEPSGNADDAKDRRQRYRVPRTAGAAQGQSGQQAERTAAGFGSSCQCNACPRDHCAARPTTHPDAAAGDTGSERSDLATSQDQARDHRCASARKASRGRDETLAGSAE